MFSSIAILGAGAIGSLLVEHCSSFFLQANIIACDHSLQKLESLRGRLAGLAVTSSAAEAVAEADLIFFAVKPQSFAALAREILAQTKPGALAVSVMAGISLPRITSNTGLTKIIRVMPNTALRIHCGVTGLLAAASVIETEKQAITDFFAQLGLVVPCSSEDMIDKMAAISGSGPAYVFYMMECLIAAARDLGFSDSEARTIVSATFSGASKLAEKDGNPALLRAQVTSKGGTTEAAMKVFEDRGTQGIWRSAIQAAYTRAEELGRHVR